MEDDAAFEGEGIDGEAVAPDAYAEAELIAGADAEEREWDSSFEDLLQCNFETGGEAVVLCAEAFGAVLFEQGPGLEFGVEDARVEAKDVLG